MKHTDSILHGYDNMKCIHYSDSASLPNTVAYEDIDKLKLAGVLKANRYVEGKLIQTYTEKENHVGVIAATRLGKTTGYVIPTILSFARQLVKRSMIVSDPKGEIYRLTAATLKKEGYDVKLLNFRDHTHSECWNPLTPIFRKYRRIKEIENEVGVVETADGPRNIFRGVVYDSQPELEQAIEFAKAMLEDEVGNDIDTMATMTIPTQNHNDPYWESSARELLKAFLWAMLEDSDDELNPITEDTYSFDTIVRMVVEINVGRNNFDDHGYFTARSTESRAYRLAKNVIIENSDVTAACIMAIFNTGISIFRDDAIRHVTSCNSFEISSLSKKPTVVFINYRDEIKLHYNIISLFVQDAYRYLIEQATNKPNGELDVPFYFLIDEFGNFPAIKDFETTISACAGRNIWFILIIQSYAQLDNVYGKEVAEIIRDNLNMHIFMGSNNPDTLSKFSEECGMKTRISPLSALNGSGADIETYQIETIPLIPKSVLAHFEEGECVITEANSGYVMYSRLERYYKCDEFKNPELSSVKDYKSNVNSNDKRYKYTYIRKQKPNSRYRF